MASSFQQNPANPHQLLRATYTQPLTTHQYETLYPSVPPPIGAMHGRSGVICTSTSKRNYSSDIDELTHGTG
eukprot:scaffold2334_cov97-Skeletonema_dohrnii-CCMP3373.AAC.4